MKWCNNTLEQTTQLLIQVTIHKSNNEVAEPEGSTPLNTFWFGPIVLYQSIIFVTLYSDVFHRLSCNKHV